MSGLDWVADLGVLYLTIWNYSSVITIAPTGRRCINDPFVPVILLLVFTKMTATGIAVLSAMLFVILRAFDFVVEEYQIFYIYR